MGLFGSKKVYVSSTVRNMAGEWADRPDYLKTVVASNVLVGGGRGMGEVIKDSFLEGPGIRMRSFQRWSHFGNRYDAIGLPHGTLIQGEPAAAADVENELITILGLIDVNLLAVQKGPADFAFWAEQYMYENYPNDLETNWSNDYDEATGEVVITFAGGGTVRFTPGDWDTSEEYLFILFQEKDANGVLGDPGIYIYRRNSNANPTFESFWVETGDQYTWFPFIPVRLENEFLSPTYHSEAYDLAKKAYRRAFGRNDYDDVVEKIGESESLDDIDHAYIMFGASVNSPTKAVKRYIWEFFSMLHELVDSSGDASTLAPTKFDAWRTTHQNVALSYNNYEVWEITANDDDPGNDPDPIPPTTYSVTGLPSNAIRVASSNNLPGKLDVEISWSAIIKGTSQVGLGKPDAAVGDIWFSTEETYSTEVALSGPTIDNKHRIRLYRQQTETTFDYIEFIDLKHINRIYDGKFVEISLFDALAETEDSGFVVPLHYEALTRLSMVDSTQLSVECATLVFNSYEVVKTGLIGSVFFNFVLAVVVTVVASVVAPGVGTGVAGSFAASIGVSGVAALIINATINVLAGMIISAIVSPLAREVLGDKIGAIVGTIVTAVAMNGLSNMSATGSFTMGFSQMSLAQTLITMTQLTASAYQAYLGAMTAETIGKIQDLQEEYADKNKELEALYAQNIGYGNGVIDPMDLVDASGVSFEAPSAFLNRTLLTGSDIAEASLRMLSNFSDFTLNLDLPLQ